VIIHEERSMPAKRELTMRQIRQMLRLARDGVSAREIARLLGVARSTAQDNSRPPQEAGLAWPLPVDLDDAVLEERLFARSGVKRGFRRLPEPDWTALACELKRLGSHLESSSGGLRRIPPSALIPRPIGAGHWAQHSRTSRRQYRAHHQPADYGGMAQLQRSQRILRKKFVCPTVIEKDGTAMAFGEHRRIYPTIKSLVFVKLGTGIGTGIVVDGKPYRGMDGGARDVGHISLAGKTDKTPPLCRCGNFGCVEAYASGWALVRDLAALHHKT
jgi:hypothetical protein